MIVHAQLRQHSTGARDAPTPQQRHVQVDADTYESGHAKILAELPDGWIIASWRVER